ncbi:hypothetical protein BBK36DRAFT_1142353 [Trichoderma citrinoviride]|uniref:GRF-type domain-containing protein n=1 Tax=Trichoderma citrinoviride TaxID=58853 RepID=A0A2T4B7P8_9HYPO|nr:hypothetical protein BBK36DRAFT_1142353 [Trichoderma citrinoviride]PTB65363.1 hypothetical protein BBK36DRAFT_1142353 [Trichoderma citrinoviride]
MATTATPSSNRYQNVYPGTPSSEKRRLKGLWYRNEWWCNCSPRARAVARNVTSNTPNKGKGFWVCRLPPSEGCGFFLFFEEARLREISLSGEAPPDTPSRAGPSLTQTRLTDIGFQVLGRRRGSDPGLLSQTEAGDDGAGRAAAEPMSSSQPEAERRDTEGRDAKGKGRAVDRGYEPLTPGTSGGLKRKFEDAFDDDDDELNSDDERQLAAMTDRSVEKFLREQAYNIHGAPADGQEEILASSSQPVARKLFPQAQHSAAAEGEEDVLATSSKPVARTLFPQAQGSTAKRTKTVSFEEPEPPTPSRTPHVRGSQSSQAESSSQTSPPSSMDNGPTFSSSIMTATQRNEDDDDEHGGGHDDVTEQVMGLLQTQQSIEPSVLESVRKILQTSARRTKGIAMGRDSARAAVNEKKTKIARLQERIVALENKEQVLNSQITHIKASLMKMYEDN